MALKKIRILYLITQSNFGGAQKYVFDLATNLDKEKYEVAVAAGLDGGGELFEKLEKAGIQIFKRPCLHREICPFCDIKAYFKLKKLLRAWQPDILHLNSSKISILGSLAARKFPIKVIYTVHGAVFKATFSWMAKKIFLWSEKLTAKYKHKIICVSEADRQLWLKYSVAPPEKLITIHNGIDLKIEFLPKSESRQKFLAISHPDFNQYQIIGWNGWFYPEKNLALLIKAASLLLNSPVHQNKKILFLIFGNGPEEKRLKSMVKEFKLEQKILFAGAVLQSAKYLKAFDVFVLSSSKEGLPYTILEAMAAGVPIIASNVGGIPEMITDNFNGFLIKPTDQEALAEKILQLIENQTLSKKFAQNSKEKLKDFSLERMISQTIQQY